MPDIDITSRHKYNMNMYFFRNVSTILDCYKAFIPADKLQCAENIKGVYDALISLQNSLPVHNSVLLIPNPCLKPA